MLWVISFILYFSSQLHAKALIVHCDFNPPLNYVVNEGKDFLGFTTELAKKAFSELGLDYELSINSNSKNIELLKKGKIDAILSLERTDQFEDSFLWVGPLIANKWVLVGRRSKDYRLKYLKDASGYKIGVRQFHPFNDLLKSNGINAIQKTSSRELALELKENKINLWATGSLSLDYNMWLLRFNDYKVAFTSKEGVYIYMAFRKDSDPALINKINIALRKLRVNGTYNELMKKYFPKG
ncbi:MAG: ABC transporter substrate-binding protein [Bdellovibrionales bacterium]|jgi:polar amino acid transport system substrate-binding protein|nr:ABC transporter substrate-binding protein [Bdellovibrionales bacterium]